MKFASLFGVFLPLLIGGCSAISKVDSPQAFDFPIIDGHIHFHSESFRSSEQPSQELQAAFRKSRVRAAIVHLSAAETRSLTLNRAQETKFAICAAARPEISPALVEEGIKAGRFQCLKIYLGYVPRWASDPIYHPFYKLAEKYQIPVVFHTGDTYDKMAKVKYADPLTVDEIAVTYPKVKFVLAHMGNPWIQSAAEVVYKNDNVYADTSALMIEDISQKSTEMIDELVVKPIRWFYLYVENPDKIIFGTDWPLAEIQPYKEAVMRAIPPEHWKKVFHDNAARLFKLESN